MLKIVKFPTKFQTKYAGLRGSDWHDKHIHCWELTKNKNSFDEYQNASRTFFSRDFKNVIFKNDQHQLPLTSSSFYLSIKNSTVSKQIKLINYCSLIHLINCRRNFQSNCKLCQEAAKEHSIRREEPLKVPFLKDGESGVSSLQKKEKFPKPLTQIKPKEKVNKEDNKSSDLNEVTALMMKSKVEKPSIFKRIIAEVKHFYHGFKLLFYDIYVSSTLLFRLAKGQTLRRREKRLLMRTIGDIFRLIPFSVIILVPFMELSLPLLLKLFPGMLPSTFQTKADKELKMKQTLKVKLEMAKFLQDTLQDMASKHKCVNCTQETTDFAEFFSKVRAGGGTATNEEILKFSRLFSDNITLDTLPRPQLIALCRVLEIQTFGTTSFLRFQLEMRLRNLAADDQVIQKEGVQSLDMLELQQACKARGMRAHGLTEKELRTQLQQWIDLSMNSKVPPSLLLLSRVFMLHDRGRKGSQSQQIEHIATAISHLPESAAIQAKESAGIVDYSDNKMRMDIVKSEYKIIKDERREDNEEDRRIKQRQNEVKKVDDGKHQYPYVKSVPVQVGGLLVCRPAEKTYAEDTVTSSDINAILNAAHSMGAVASVEKELLLDIKEKLEGYREDEVLVKAGGEEELLKTVAEQRLFKAVDKMTSKIDNLVKDITENKADIIQVNADIKALAKDSADMREQLLKLDEVINVIKRLQKFPNNWRLKIITEMLSKMVVDKNSDTIKVDTLIKVVELLGKENFHLSKQQIDEVIELIKKEEFLEIESRVEKTLQKHKSKEKNDHGGKLKIATSVSGGKTENRKV